jgi:small subunit ribosomal protein S6
MKNYELLFILPGTLGEDEVSPIVDNVKDVIEKAGGQEIKVQDLGKSRIAYPMKHIRYGYFQLCQFKAESKNIVDIKEKLRLISNLLRFVINKVGAEPNIVLDKISAISDVTTRHSTRSVPEEKKIEEKEKKEEEHVTAGHQMDSVEQKTKTKTETKEDLKTETKVENIKLDDIDKKLDELLDTNITDV